MSASDPLRTLAADGRLSAMGTLGGKIGIALGLVAGLLAFGPLIGLVLGDCFFEQGCKRETAGLALVAIGSLVIAVITGVLVRELANRLLRTNR